MLPADAAGLGLRRAPTKAWRCEGQRARPRRAARAHRGVRIQRGARRCTRHRPERPRRLCVARGALHARHRRRRPRCRHGIIRSATGLPNPGVLLQQGQVALRCRHDLLRRVRVRRVGRQPLRGHRVAPDGPRFQGTRSTTEGLEHFLVLSPELKARLQLRGERCCTVATGHTYVEHTQGAFLPAPRGRAGASSSSSALSKARSAGRMMVDVNAAWERGVHCARTGGEACEAVVGTLKLVAQRQRASGEVMSMEYYGVGGGGAGGATSDESSLELLLLSKVPPSLLWLTWPCVAGFSFAAKSWGVALVTVARRRSMTGRSNSWCCAVAQSHRGSCAVACGWAETVDVIAGKGEGSIFLLHGPPGVGKTLTAELLLSCCTSRCTRCRWASSARRQSRWRATCRTSSTYACRGARSCSSTRPRCSSSDAPSRTCTQRHGVRDAATARVLHRRALPHLQSR